MYLEYYLNLLGYNEIPDFLVKYLMVPSLVRLKKVGYFCGMDYASKNIYDFREYISRFDHSLTVCLLTYKLTKDKIMALSGLFHDIATPCFSHVIDYMNQDYENQESTEEKTEEILLNDEYLRKCLEEDRIDISDVINFKKYTIVDNERPKLCADRLDGVILTGIGWTKNITLDEIKDILDNLKIFKNEDGEDEIGFTSLEVAKRVIDISKAIDIYCHSNEDNYMMELLAKITRLAISNNYITYDELYTFDEEELLHIFNVADDKVLLNLIDEFQNIKMEDIPNIELPKVKIRKLNPLLDNKRLV